ncbi:MULTISPECIES: ABC transporter substrate-binding protein [unclassified Pseudomonas]|uniref:substrate-binding periplasmic protein n=1 Tax=unclassified Pseudomonas TaxID=196821 RepID=UPI000BC69EC9|nr:MULTISPECIES: transporter substrate-binding domain-containing protein [unclassified Pseudomonas]PVZ16482.1 polar amino acid transport system substrate-binding protein [Pseudomonas sp. URIL14HWK12:I12]PVZ25662.1 polar amino acid transport system substrate-binding protein [Pseudomonas sp. URIL14HWK12:I10]PVZ36814.1 polar amino acid transport system substrate-binding protein [Pseudomonas sp. URIL14HWK12:I11]SNZ12560.1 amino acid ABC transporter substrate-binding protein, PAAT family (TC 3.A.1.3
MRIARFGLWGWLALVAATGQCLAAPALRVVTEELPPYNMMSSDGRVTGLSTEIVQAVMREAGASARIEVLPWARAYDMALNVPNVLIYSIARTAEREPLFQWVGALAPTRWYLYSLADRPVRLDNLADARGHQIATVHEDVGEQYLIGKGFKPGSELQATSKYEYNYRKLKVDHVELWISNELNAVYLVRKNGDDPDKVLVKSLALPELSRDEGLSLAFSRGTPPETVDRFRAALARLRADGTIEAILNKWLRD